MIGSDQQAIEVVLHAAVVAVDGDDPKVLIGGDGRHRGLPALPYGSFHPEHHQTLEKGLRDWVEHQTHLSLGYVEQLYTFGDQGRLPEAAGDPTCLLSVGYLALVRQPRSDRHQPHQWQSWYHHLPWEDWRDGAPTVLTQTLLPALGDWVRSAPESRLGNGLERLVRFRLAFGCDLPTQGTPIVVNWDDERVLERYELMYEAGLVDEAVADGRWPQRQTEIATGGAMLHDHRRILATAVARLRGKLKYRPVVFELLPEEFTLTQLQRTVETLAGRMLHKQNFRRMVENADLVEPTGARASGTGGRPAALYRFRRAILRERPAPGLRIGASG